MESFHERLVQWGREHFNITLEAHKVIYPDGTSDYISKVDFNGLQVILLLVNILKKYKSLLL